MSYTLVVVDMQSSFMAANEPSTIIGVSREIMQALKNRASIIFLEFQGCTPTHPAFFNLVRGYKNKARIIKPHDDGSKEVLRTLKRRGFHNKTLRVCGVNTQCCVWQTVHGLLLKASAKIELVKDACGPDYDWRTYLRHSNLKLI